MVVGDSINNDSTQLGDFHYNQLTPVARLIVLMIAFD
jgi:hypothetical protein